MDPVTLALAKSFTNTQTQQSALNAYMQRLAQNQPVRIECWGDSTYAAGTPIATFQQALRDYYNNEAAICVNKGMSGDGTANRIKTWSDDMAASTADIIYMNYCINDAKGSANPEINPKIDGETYHQNLRTMVAIARQHGRVVVLETPNATSHHNGIGPSVVEDVKQFAQIMRQVASEMSVPLIDQHRMFERWLGVPGVRAQDLLPDGYHPNAMAYRAKGMMMSMPLIHPEPPRVLSPMLVPAIGPATRASGTNERAVSTPQSRVGYAKAVNEPGASIRLPIWIDSPGLDVYLALPIWQTGSEAAEVFVDTESVGELSLRDTTLGSSYYAIDHEILVIENASPGFHLVEVRDTTGEGRINSYYLRAHPTRVQRLWTKANAGQAPTPLTGPLISTDIAMRTASDTVHGLLLTDIPVSRFLRSINVEFSARFLDGDGVCLFASGLADGSSHGGLFAFLNSSGGLRVSEGSGKDGFVNATNVYEGDLRGEEHTYRILVDPSGLATFFVDESEVGTYQMTSPRFGGFFALYSNSKDRTVRVKDLTIY